MHENMKQSYI